MSWFEGEGVTSEAGDEGRLVFGGRLVGFGFFVGVAVGLFFVESSS